MGTYQVLRTVARGGMAELLLAKSEGPHGFAKQVVLKRIHPHLADDPGFVEMFLDEARLAAQLDHPNVVSVFDLGDGDDGTFFAMEYLRGADVRRLLAAAGGRLPLEHAVAIAAGTAAGLHHAHTRVSIDGVPLSVIHRDVSPTNIIVTYEGAVKVVDFGIAKATTNQRHTAQSRVKGKVPYMSPEQCSGARLDARSDVFSLGSVLYEMTTGHRPFAGDAEFAVMSAIVRGVTVKDPATLRAGYPEALQAIVARAMAREPDERYQSAEALRLDLERFAASQGWTLSAGALGDFVRSHVPESHVDQTDVDGPHARHTGTAPTVAAPTPQPAARRRSMARVVAVLSVLGVGATWVATRPSAEGPNRDAASDSLDEAHVASPEPKVAEPAPEPKPEPEPKPTSDAILVADDEAPAETPLPEVPEPAAADPSPQTPPTVRAPGKGRKRTRPRASEKSTTPSVPNEVDGNAWVPIRRTTP